MFFFPTRHWLHGAILCLAIGPAYAQAQAPASEASIARLLKNPHFANRLSGTLSELAELQSAWGQLAGELSKDDPAFQRFLARSNEIIREESSGSRIEASIVQRYAQHFSESEVQGMTAFFESPAGRAYLEKMPLLLQDMVAISDDVKARALPRLQAVVKELEAEIAARRAPADSSKKSSQPLPR